MSVKIGELKQVAMALKSGTRKADSNGDGKVTEAEVRGYGAILKDSFGVGEAMLTFRRWAKREHRSPSVANITQKIDAAVGIIERRDTNADGIISSGKELNSLKRLKTFQALRSLSDRMPFEPGDTFNELLNRATGIRKSKYTDPARVPASLAPLVIAAANVSSYASTTLADVFAQVDQGEVVVRRLKDPKSGRALIAVDYGAGDNTYGALFDAKTKNQLAGIQDGDLYPPGA